MLVLSRKADETILVGDDVRITIVRVSGTQVRVGIDAPHETLILRGELAEEASRGEAA
jgi:carbon storage regulator